jgi:hypothetical protein
MTGMNTDLLSMAVDEYSTANAVYITADSTSPIEYLEY